MKLYKDKIDMMSLLRKITPLARTIANNDTDKALQMLTEFLPGAFIEGFPSGSKAWSWTIPRRWELDGATIRANGETLVDVAWNPLHVIDYSQPFKGTVEREELLKHLHTIPERPQAIPFVFSFYEPVWGFSIPHDWLSRFTSDTYEVEINSRFDDGNLNTLSLLIPGDSEETFVICSNICHPTQVNDSLTGVAVTLDIASRLLARERRKYSYLIMVVPETIGSIAYLSNHPEIINTSIGGFFSEMLGTNGPLVGQRTRRGDTYWDKILEDVLTNSNLPNKIVSFLKSACNDEKVLDSPGVDIPTFSLTRFPYPEYHTSDDNIELIDVERIREARDLLQEIIDLAEEDYIPVLNQPGPIFLSGYGLYPNWRDDPSLIPLWESFFDVMYSIDGVHSVIELANLRQIPISHFFIGLMLLLKRDY
ncbi:DUF4910 domain-containing protein [Leptospira noguchii]|nr:DUF4910 domain-containing protein [Leptospira noguchii]